MHILFVRTRILNTSSYFEALFSQRKPHAVSSNLFLTSFSVNRNTTLLVLLSQNKIIETSALAVHFQALLTDALARNFSFLRQEIVKTMEGFFLFFFKLYCQIMRKNKQILNHISLMRFISILRYDIWLRKLLEYMEPSNLTTKHGSNVLFKSY